MIIPFRWIWDYSKCYTFLIMVLKENREIKSLILKFGVALALSFAGFLFARVKIKRIKPSMPPPDNGNEVSSSGTAALDSTDSYHKLKIAAINYENIDDYEVLSPRGKCSEDREEHLVPEFNKLVVTESNMASFNTGLSPSKITEIPIPDIEKPTIKSTENNEYEQEIKSLKNTIKILRERERNLEIQLLEYYGLKEQETAVMELQNRVKINNTEAKLFNLKIESLQAQNRELEAKVADFPKVVDELEAAKAKIKLLKRKFRSFVEQNKEHILTLQQRVAKLQDDERGVALSDEDIRLKLHRLECLEKEVEDLKNSNLRLELGNSELGQRLEATHVPATCVLEDSEAASLKEKNTELAREIEQLQENRCADVEELVYLRWINACLRYELRNYQPPPGKTVAKDLSKTLSPKSEEKAKKLILEYANTEGIGDKRISLSDFDSDIWSTSQASYLTDSSELDDSSSSKPNSSTKTKLLTKLRRLIRGKESSRHSSEMVGPFSLGSPFDSNVSTVIDSGGSEQSAMVTTRSSSSPLRSIGRFGSLNIEEKYLGSLRRRSDVGSPYGYKRLVFRGENVIDEFEKSELAKYAGVLMDSRDGMPPKIHRKSASYSS